MANLIFPSNLTSSGSNYVSFTAKDKGGAVQGNIALYMPPNVAFADGAGYTTFDMGPLGNDIASRIQNGVNAESVQGMLNDMTSRVNASQDLRTIMAGKMLQNAAAVPGMSNVGDIYQQSKSIAMNPNTVTAFQNMNIRTFVFNFKLVADNQQESAKIKDIQNIFRGNMYASRAAGGYMLSYPAKWFIKFKNGQGTENPYYPKIYESYLTNFTTNFNSSGHLHHRDGAPTEVDISITFQETRVLTKNDIAEMEGI